MTKVEKLFEIVPPHSVEIEECVLGSMLIQDLAYEIAVEMLTPEDFYVSRSRWLFVKFVNIFTRMKTLDEKLVIAEIAKCDPEKENVGRDYIGRLIMRPTSAVHIEGYCNSLLEFKAKRKRLNFALRILKDYVGKPEARTARETNPTARAGTGAEGVAK